MSQNIGLLLDDDDDLLAKACEDSLSHYNSKSLEENEFATVDDIILIDDDSNSSNGKIAERKSVLCSQVGGKAGEVLYNGDEAKGFHLAAGSSYIYPTNYPVRQYQSNIVHTALFKNTMVTLPTGLGKTFIAAVVMYNFYRWYPCGKVVFMAPTRPLVAQQIKACHHIMNIPLSDTTEMTGVQNVDVRKSLWKERRVFFLTPQVLVNDLRSSACPAELIKCVVVDEAHRAVKDYAYCQVIKLLQMAKGSEYRVLALSATPGNGINAVQQVIENLQIAALEIRGEDSLDVAPYTHSRAIDTIVVSPSSEMKVVRDDFLKVYEKYARRLKEFKVLTNNISTVTKFQVLKAMEKFRANPPRGMSSAVVGSLICDFTICMSLAHSLELLEIYGLRAFYSYLSDDTREKCKAASSRLKNDEDLAKLLKKLKTVLYNTSTQNLPYIWSHPKLQHLVTSLSTHFKKADESKKQTKAIVFCQYRTIVSEIVELLEKSKPLIKSAIFIGQSGGKEKGMPQAKQLQIMKEFRDGTINCLVATCVAEEGLDIGEVDLIILMEAHKSPGRLVQRIGRTGRKRKGHCIILLTKGKEEQKFHEAMMTRKSYVNNICNSSAIKASLCQFSPSMFPPNVKPVKQLVHISVDDDGPTPEKPKKQIDIRNCMPIHKSPFLTEEEYEVVFSELGTNNVNMDHIPRCEEIWHRRFSNKMGSDELFSKKWSRLYFWNDWNLEVHKSFKVSNTLRSQHFCELLQSSRNVKNFVNISDEELEQLIVNESSRKEDNESRNRIVGKKTAKLPEENEEKKAKKKKLNSKNDGMDIRSCMAIAAEKAKVEIIDIRSPDSPVPIEIDDEQIEIENGSKIFKIDEKYLKELLYSEALTCAFEKNVEMGYRLNKYLTPKPVYPLQIPKFDTSLNIDFLFKPNTFKNLNIMPQEKLMIESNDNIVKTMRVNADSLPNNLKNLNLTADEKLMIECNDKREEIMTDNADSLPDTVKISSEDEESNDIVGIDDLFDNADFSPDDAVVEENKEKSKMVQLLTNSQNKENHEDVLNSLQDEKDKLMKKDESKTDPDIVSIDDLFGDDDLFEDDCVKSKEESFTPEKLFNKTAKKDVNLFNDMKQPSKNSLSKNKFQIEVESLLENNVLSESPVSCNTNSNNSLINSAFISSTPKYTQNKGKTFKKSINKIETQVKKDEEKDLWEISALFDEDDDMFANVELPPSRHESTMFSVTQLTSMIMKDKKQESRQEISFKNSPDESCEKTITYKKHNESLDCPKKSVNKINEGPVCTLDFQEFDTETQQNSENTNANFKKFKNKIQTDSICKNILPSQKIHLQSEQSDDDFISPAKLKRSLLLSPSPSPSPNKVARKKKTKKPKQANEYIEYEAEESGILSSDESCDTSNSQDEKNSFIDDESLSDADITNTHYLKSVKSPMHGKFKIPSHCNNQADVYSQQVEQDVDYQNDSFCVDSEEEITIGEPSMLEIAEKKLAKKKGNKLKRKDPEPGSSTSETSFDDQYVTPNFTIIKKRKPIIESDSESDITPKAKKKLKYSESPKKKSPRNEEVKDIPDDECSDEDLKKALRLSQIETKFDFDSQLEKDIQKAILLSQMETVKPTFQRLLSAPQLQHSQTTKVKNVKLKKSNSLKNFKKQRTISDAFRKV